MIRRKKEIKRIFFTIFFIIAMCLSSVQILNNLTMISNNSTSDRFNENLGDGLPQTSISNVNENFTGSGVDQDVRVYVNNKSQNFQNNENYFEIPSLPSEDMFLVSGDFNFTLQNNYTTEYILENNDALYARDFIRFDYENSGSSSIIINDGILISGGFGSITDESNSTSIYIDADQGVLNFTIVADFSGTTYTSGVINGNVQFNRLKILGFLSELAFRLFADANLTVQVENYALSSWVDIISNLPINSSLGLQSLEQHIINENLNFIDLSDVCHIRFVFERFDKQQYYARLYEYDIKATYGFDLSITNQSYVALEFDLKGEKSAVNGFYAWIRTLNLTEAPTTQLNISLYRSNRTIVRTESNLRNVALGPDYAEMIDTFTVNGYTGDCLSYFEFNIANTGALNLSNYFIVIKSDNPLGVYSLVTLPWFDYGDRATEHQLKITTDDGVIWRNAKKVITTTNRPYTSGQLDASSFKLNVTRGYMPSDFIYNGNQTLRIQDLPLIDLEDRLYPYSESSYLTWGLGRWNYSFTSTIEDDVTNIFKIELKWNKSLVKGFKFNISSYSANAYWVETAASTYSVSYNNAPNWLFTYNFNVNNPLFTNWKFFEFWYVFYDYFQAYNVTNPLGEKVLPPGEDQSALNEDPNKDKIIVNNSLATQSGFYTLNLTSYDFIHDMNSYINYKGIFWESNGFMNGDNMTIRVDIQDHLGKAPNGGDVNATLFYPDGSKFIELDSSSGYIDDSVLVYDFNNQTVLEITNALTTYGEYTLGLFWFNGSAIGCKNIPIYIDLYYVELSNLKYYSQLGTNVLSGEILNKVYQDYTLLVASINETTGMSMTGFYPINNTNLDTTFSYKIGGQKLELLLTYFQQNQNILNPGETVTINLELQNLHEFLPVNVKVDIKLVSYVNEEWIIAEDTTSYSTLSFSGSPNDSDLFSADLVIPDLDEVTKIWNGVNAPIRLGGAKTIITIYIEDIIVGEYTSPDYALLSNKTSNNFDGYILGLRVAEDTPSRSILYAFQRDECIYFPDNSTFLVNIIDKNYVSCYQQFVDEFSIYQNSKFTSVSVNPNRPLEGETFDLNSTLTTEFGDVLIGKNVSCSYLFEDNWVLIDSAFTDSKGITIFQINTQTIEFEDEILINLNWEGDSLINGISKNITVEFVQQINNLSISITSNAVQIIKGKVSTFNIRLINIGNSNLKINNISIEFDHNEAYSIVQIDYNTLNWFSPRESSIIIVEVSLRNFYNIGMTVTITAQNIITNETIVVFEDVSYGVFDPSIFDLLFDNFMLIIIGSIALIFILAFIIIRRTQKKIETPVVDVSKKPRRGRYVSVSELKKPLPAKKPIKKKEEPKKETEKEKVDLDSLLEERGLGETKKKPKE